MTAKRSSRREEFSRARFYNCLSNDHGTVRRAVSPFPGHRGGHSRLITRRRRNHKALAGSPPPRAWLRAVHDRPPDLRPLPYVSSTSIRLSSRFLPNRSSRRAASAGSRMTRNRRYSRARPYSKTFLVRTKDPDGIWPCSAQPRSRRSNPLGPPSPFETFAAVVFGVESFREIFEVFRARRLNVAFTPEAYRIAPRRPIGQFVSGIQPGIDKTGGAGQRDWSFSPGKIRLYKAP